MVSNFGRLKSVPEVNASSDFIAELGSLESVVAICPIRDSVADFDRQIGVVGPSLTRLGTPGGEEPNGASPNCGEAW